MFKELIKNIIQGKSYCAAEHTYVQQKPQINFLLLKKYKSEFIVEKKGIYREVNDLFQFLKKQQHLFLIINNEQVLTKSVAGKLDTSKAVQTAFPNLNSNDFYYESYHNDTDTFISICRKTYVDGIIRQYKKAKINIINFSLDNLSSANLLPYINKSKLYTSNAVLSIKNKELINIKETKIEIENIYTINDLEINSSYILSLGGILSYYTGIHITQKSFDEKVSELQNRFNQIKFFDLGLKIGLGFIFTLLLFNFLIFSTYRKKINFLKNEVVVNENYKGNLMSLKNEVVKKKQIVEKITDSKSSKVSKYLDRIGASIPEKILLKQINYQPPLKNVKNGKEIRYQIKLITISGESLDGTMFSGWISSLEQEKWINDITLVKYGTGKKTITEFQLKITLSE